MDRAYIRPVYNSSEQLLSLALCRTNLQLLTDEQIIEHFDPHTSGKEIKAIASEMGYSAEWGRNIQC